MAIVENMFRELSDEEFIELEYDENYVTLRPPAERRSRILFFLGVLAGLLVIVLLIGRSWVSNQIYSSGPQGEEIEVVIPARATSAEVASILAANQIVPNSTFFRVLATYRSHTEFMSGAYTFSKNSSADEALAVLREGPIVKESVKVVLPSGIWFEEAVALIAKEVPSVSVEDLRAATTSGDVRIEYRPEGQSSIEGLILPDSYDFLTEATAEEIIAELHERFVSAAAENNFGTGRAERDFQMTAYEALVIASMVEAEAKVDGDMTKISRVIHNRLKEGMPLDVESTLYYSGNDRTLTPDQLWVRGANSSDPYNTSSRARAVTAGRLPPTPIGAPSRKAMQAALFPASGEWLYYSKTDNDGSYYFSVTEDEYRRAIARARAEGVEGV